MGYRINQSPVIVVKTTRSHLPSFLPSERPKSTNVGQCAEMNSGICKCLGAISLSSAIYIKKRRRRDRFSHFLLQSKKSARSNSRKLPFNPDFSLQPLRTNVMENLNSIIFVHINWFAWTPGSTRNTPKHDSTHNPNQIKSSHTAQNLQLSVEKPGSKSDSLDESRVLSAAFKKLSAVDNIGNTGNVEVNEDDPGEELEEKCCSSNCVGNIVWGNTALSLFDSCSCRLSDIRLEVEVDRAELWNKFVFEQDGRMVDCSEAAVSVECLASNMLVCVARVETEVDAFNRCNRSCRSQVIFMNEAGWSPKLWHSVSLEGGMKKWRAGIGVGSVFGDSLWNWKFRLAGLAAAVDGQRFIKLKVVSILPRS